MTIYPGGEKIIKEFENGFLTRFQFIKAFVNPVQHLQKLDVCLNCLAQLWTALSSRDESLLRVHYLAFASSGKSNHCQLIWFLFD